MQIHRFVPVLLLQAALACSADTVPSNPSNTSAASSAGAGRSASAPDPAPSANAGSVAVGSASNPAAASCPALRPAETSACPADPRVCVYDEIECSCPSGTWDCAEPVDPNCPPAMPVHASPCSVPEGTECEFLQDECSCTSGRWSCEAFELEDAGVASEPTTPPPAADAGMPAQPRESSCPDLRPIEGLSCSVAAETCVYDTTACVCPSGSWLCQEAVDPACPLEPPTPGTMCTGNADCDYFSIECECRASSWTCKEND